MSIFQPLLVAPELLQKDLSGRRFIVTGGTSGVGLQTAVQLLKQGGHVVVACRSVDDKRAKTLRDTAEKLPGKVEICHLDLTSLSSVRSFAALFIASYGALDVLVNNAGVMGVPYSHTADGFETHFGVNYLAHFLLTKLLMPLLEASSFGGRVVNVSSCNAVESFGFGMAHLSLSDPNFEDRSFAWTAAYGQSKLAQVLHARELSRRHPKVVSMAINPGSVFTDITRHGMPLWMRKAWGPIEKALTGTVDVWVGSQTGLHCILADDIENGAFYSARRSPSWTSGGWPAAPHNTEATDDSLAGALWKCSEEWVEHGYKPSAAKPIQSKSFQAAWPWKTAGAGSIMLMALALAMTPKLPGR